jgi:ATP-dependent Clp protease ATP-binding subunit ClpA
MFERFTEKARRTIFYARHEASQFGSPQIESEHLLLGLLREDKGALAGTLGLENSEVELRTSMDTASVDQTKSSSSGDLPFSDECKRILEFAFDEAERLGSKPIGIGHVMLGILREENCRAARFLKERGLEPVKARLLIFVSDKEPEAKDEATGASTTSGPSYMMRRQVTEIQVVDAGTSEVLLTYQTAARVPCVGETILIRVFEIQSQAYKVQDVLWELEQAVGNSVLKEVRVLVARVET